ncbi:hypothetical protein DPEC_G00316500 [Dallia pectoralis]|uniref:Uncharacterized protein n=1 Tax=Dallia pectoralis TaxID=75939 RepID=A0ACC2FCZ2_DALPE|nr:hypothetical protein DPEC_G00316500 [Dallia pectoralis]
MHVVTVTGLGERTSVSFHLDFNPHVKTTGLSWPSVKIACHLVFLGRFVLDHRGSCLEWRLIRDEAETHPHTTGVGFCVHVCLSEQTVSGEGEDRRVCRGEQLCLLVYPRDHKLLPKPELCVYL